MIVLGRYGSIILFRDFKIWKFRDLPYEMSDVGFADVGFIIDPSLFTKALFIIDYSLLFTFDDSR